MVIEGGSKGSSMPVIMLNVGNVRNDRAQTFPLKIYHLISTIHLKTLQNCQRMDDFTHSLMHSTSEHFPSTLPGLMLAAGDAWYSRGA